MSAAYHLIRCHNKNVTFTSENGNITEICPEGVLLLSGRDCHIESFAVPYSNRADILDYLNRELKKNHPKPDKDILIDFIKLSKKTILAVYIYKNQLEKIREKTGKKKIYLPKPVGTYLALKHYDGIYEIYDECLKSSNVLRFSKNIDMDMQQDFLNKEIFEQGKKKPTILINALIFFALVLLAIFPLWKKVSSDYKLLKEITKQYAIIKFQNEKNSGKVSEYNNKLMELQKITSLLKPQVDVFTKLLIKSNIPPLGLERLTFNEGTFSLSLWTAQPNILIKQISEIDLITNMNYSGDQIGSLTRLQISGVLRE